MEINRQCTESVKAWASSLYMAIQENIMTPIYEIDFELANVNS